MYEYIDRTDLYQFGFDGSRFKKIRGGREWHGPCPWCGGKDRMLIFNGTYWCRQCYKSGTLASLLREPISPEEAEKLRSISEAKRKREEEKERQEKNAKLRALNNNKPWIKFHKDLLERPDLLQQLEKDGITMEAVIQFQLGFIPDFRYRIDGVGYNGPGIVFPIKNGRGMHNLRIRLLEIMEGDKYRPFMAGVGAGFFKADFHDIDWVVIVEGEKKAIVCWLNGIPAIGIQGCWTFKEEWIPWMKKQYSHIYLVLDPDQANLKSEKRLAEMLNASVIHLDGKPDDLIVQGKMTVHQFIKMLSQALYLRR